MTNPVLTPAMRAVLAADSKRLIHFLMVSLDSVTVLMTDAYRDLNWSNANWVALGHFLGFEGAEANLDMSLTTTRITLSAVDQAYLALFLNEQYVNRRARIWLGALDDSYQVIANPIEIASGRMDQPQVALDPETGTIALSVDVIDEWKDFNQVRGRRTNDHEQRLLFPGDHCFELAHNITAPIFWGRRQTDRNASKTRPR